MARQRHKKLIISRSHKTAVTKTLAFDVTHPTPTKVIRWSDRDGNQHEIYLFSDNYPNLPSQLISIMSAANQRWLNANIDVTSYWFNSYPHLTALLDSVSGTLNLNANLTKSSYKNIRRKVRHSTIFFDWLSLESTTFNVASISDVSLDVLRSFRDYLYYVHDKDKLSKGGNNQAIWQSSIPTLLTYFLKRPKYNLAHPSLNSSNFPKFSNPINDCNSVKPYSDIESFAIISSSDNYCKDYMHNWFVMRSIESINIGSWDNINDICWVIVNIECNSSQDIRASAYGQPFVYLRQYFGMTCNDFYNKYSFNDIREMAKMGCCPYYQYRIDMLDGLTDSSRQQLAQSFIRWHLRYFFDVRASVLADAEEPNWKQLLYKLRSKSNYLCSGKSSQFQIWWEAAGFKKILNQSDSWLISLFIPTTNSLFPFHLFVMATSGANLEVINSIDRNIVLSDIDATNVVYRGVKKRTGQFNYRFEDIVVPRDETHGIHKRITFVKEITNVFHRFNGVSAFSNHLWVGLHMKNSRFPKIVSFSNNGYPYYNTANKYFSLCSNLQEIKYTDSIENASISPMHKIHVKRLRKTYVHKDMNLHAPYHLIQAALADNSFETVFRWYIDTSVQRRFNFKAIAAIQEVLMENIAKYSREREFAGAIVYDMDLSDTKDISNNYINACTDHDHARVLGREMGCKCTIQQFDVCLGCLNSRVFREHLPNICFRILQYDDKKRFMAIDDWSASYGIHRSRAENCLMKYASRSDIYRSHVDDAWSTAKAENGVYLPPLF